MERTARSLLIVAALVASGCKQSEKTETKDEPRTGHAEASNEVTARATVTAVDRAARSITLKREDGKTFGLLCGPEVRNFDQIAMGDTLKVRYKESLAVELKAPGAAVEPASATVAAGRAQAGEKPGGAIGAQLNATVRIESVDLESNIVVFTTPDGRMETVRVVRPEGKEFIRKLKKGDNVEITYTEAVAITVDKE
jgi:hypothetical protein